ncbi:MAG TPA: hypothetical protein VD731_01500 [Nitrosopumilaceae archaeon]|nr:hypothetical protein [Nitrosopumilaceae archaeon]
MIKTPQQKWKEAIVNYRKKCQKILGLSKSIRYAGIINEYGRTLTGMVRPNTIPLWSAEEVKNEFFIISTLMTLRKLYAQKVGALDYLLLSHPKVTIIAFQRKNITYYVSIDIKTKNIEGLATKIKKII